MNILVIDDDPHISRLYTKTLINAGHNVHTALQLRDAYDYLSKTTPDLMCLDWHIGRELGENMLSHLNENYAPDEMPIVIIISGKFEGVDISAYEHIVQKVLLKPVTPRDLTAYVKKLADENV
jgi:two-component system, OmpR family, phosphate regulon response regulator PhoB